MGNALEEEIVECTDDCLDLRKEVRSNGGYRARKKRRLRQYWKQTNTSSIGGDLIVDNIHAGSASGLGGSVSHLRHEGGFAVDNIHAPVAEHEVIVTIGNQSIVMLKTIAERSAESRKLLEPAMLRYMEVTAMALIPAQFPPQVKAWVEEAIKGCDWQKGMAAQRTYQNGIDPLCCFFGKTSTSLEATLNRGGVTYGWMLHPASIGFHEDGRHFHRGDIAYPSPLNPNIPVQRAIYARREKTQKHTRAEADLFPTNLHHLRPSRGPQENYSSAAGVGALPVEGQRVRDDELQ
ncbi:hypothetical protein QBC38DRAFT_445630 [Podospora fimiseda]|uniref:Uncharacterized protein n=1 Tax=Podospora fimiseda TaxID=252190 RepID=A0AAN7BLA4_9PEZI|nr:hypothetical protein QBC38DRAFT_445630 [Podospora fimiseda]